MGVRPAFPDNFSRVFRAGQILYVNGFVLSRSNIVVSLTAHDHIEVPAPQITVKVTNGKKTLTRTFNMDVRQPLPATSTDLTFVANRVGFPIISGTACAGDCCGLCHSYHVSPDHAVTGGIRLLFVNFYVDGGSGNLPEKKPGNFKAGNFATVFVGGAAYPVTFNGGSQSVVIADGEFIWSDVVMNGAAELTLAFRKIDGEWRTSSYIAVGLGVCGVQWSGSAPAERCVRHRAWCHRQGRTSLIASRHRYRPVERLLHGQHQRRASRRFGHQADILDRWSASRPWPAHARHGRAGGEKGRRCAAVGTI